MGDVKRYDFSCSLLDGLIAEECDDAEYVLHSDYASLLARHNALVGAVAWERECDGLLKFIDRFWDDDNVPGIEAVMTYAAARAEVDRLIATADCKGEG